MMLVAELEKTVKSDEDNFLERIFFTRTTKTIFIRGLWMQKSRF